MKNTLLVLTIITMIFASCGTNSEQSEGSNDTTKVVTCDTTKCDTTCVQDSANN